MADGYLQPHSQPAPARKKRPKTKGCYQCSRRRIDCDRQTPKCQKCTLKGLDCSGMGIRYRFTEGVASRGKLSGKQLPSSLSYRRSPVQNTMGSVLSRGHPDEAESNTIDSSSTKFPVTGCLINTSMNDDCWTDTDISDLQLLPPPNHIDGTTLYFLQYFADHLAPVTAVIDRGFNGYRDLILPFAESDRLVRDAIVLVSRQHISLNSGDSLADSLIYDGLIRGLITRSYIGSLRHDISSMTALLLLHLREVISGSSDFKLVYGSLRALVDATALATGTGSCQLTQFVSIQILRVRLFAEALFDETYGVQYLSTHGVACLEFLRFCQRCHPEHEELMGDLFTLVTLACEVYVKRAWEDPPPEETHALVERFRQVTGNVKHYGNVIGQHLLAWPYFVMAAESSTADHREFFDGELQCLYQMTRCRSIARGLDKIHSIREIGPDIRWTSLLGGPDQFFIM